MVDLGYFVMSNETWLSLYMHASVLYVLIHFCFAGLNIASIVEYQIQLAFGLCICGKF